MGTLTETSIFNDNQKPNAISVWCANDRLTGGLPVCVQPRRFDLSTIGRPTDTRWYAYDGLLPDAQWNERCQLSSKGWIKIDLGMFAPSCYVWHTANDPMIALPAFDRKAAKTLGIEYDDWALIMKKHAIAAIAAIATH